MRRVLAPRLITALLFLALVAGYAVVGSGGSVPGRGAGPPAARTTVAVNRWVDGDTLVVTGTSGIPGDELDGRRDTETVRLIGVDTPESVGRYASHPQCYGPEASWQAKRLVPPASSAVLTFDTGTTALRDRTPSHRLLAYLWRHDDTMVNLALVEQGYARARYVPPQDDYRQLFKTAADDAKRAGKGLWGACPTR